MCPPMRAARIETGLSSALLRTPAISMTARHEPTTETIRVVGDSRRDIAVPFFRGCVIT